MSDIVSKNDVVLESFKKFVQKRAEIIQASSNSLHQNYTPILVWQDIAGSRLYFTHEKLKYFWIVKNNTIEKIAQKLFEAEITNFTIDTTHILYENYGNAAGKTRRLYNIKPKKEILKNILDKTP